MSDNQNSKSLRDKKSAIINKIVAFYPFLFIGALAFFTLYLSILYGSGFDKPVSMGKIAFCCGVASLLASIIAYLHYRRWRGWICLAMELAGFLAIL